MDYSERREKLFECLNKGERLNESLLSQYAHHSNEFQTLVDNCIERQGLKRSFVIKEAILTPSYGYKILNGQKKTKDRDVILRLLIAMKMPIDEVQRALQSYGLPILDSNSLRDDIIISGIEHQEPLDKIERFLSQTGMTEPLVKLD